MDMIETFTFEKHWVKLKCWLNHWGLPIPDKKQLSEQGWCVDGIAIGFLVSTDSAQAYMDHVCSDPNSNKIKRDDALRTLFWKIEAEAKTDGNLLLVALAQLPAMRKRFEDAGYSKAGEYGVYFKTPLGRG